MSTSTPKRGQLSFLPDEKKCYSCKKVLPVKDFYLDKRYNTLRSICKSCSVEYTKTLRKKKPITTLYNTVKNRAKRQKLPMEITTDYLKNIYPDNMICPVLGIKMERGDAKSINNSPSIDRIIPEKGYVPGNVIIVSMRANIIKSNATPDEIIKVGKFYKKLLEEIEDGSKTD